ncbi:hypothetical protein BGW80DRAFT_1301245 [Lactifluus volemus]|nr:hypothetical protein BGW80DRAFT_1301245 [Lactifluus volemus]
MLNFQDPNVIVQEIVHMPAVQPHSTFRIQLNPYSNRRSGEALAAFDDIFLWEFFTTLDLEWSVIRGNRPYRWTI